NMIFATRDQQKRRTVVIVEIDRRGRVRIEVGKARLEQDVIRAGNGVAFVDFLRLLFTQQVAEGVMELLRRERDGLVEIEWVAEGGERNRARREGQQKDALDRRGVDCDTRPAQVAVEQNLREEATEGVAHDDRGRIQTLDDFVVVIHDLGHAQLAQV